MIEVSEVEYKENISKHHQDSCSLKENEDPEFDNKVKKRAYEIWETTRKQDERTNYFQAVEEMRKELCDCDSFAKQYQIIDNSAATQNNTNEKEAQLMTPIEEEPKEEDLKQKQAEEAVIDTVKTSSDDAKNEEQNPAEERPIEVKPVDNTSSEENITEDKTTSDEIKNEEENVTEEKPTEEETIEENANVNETEQEKEGLPSLSNMIG